MVGLSSSHHSHQETDSSHGKEEVSPRRITKKPTLVVLHPMKLKMKLGDRNSNDQRDKWEDSLIDGQQKEIPEAGKIA